MSFSNKCNHIIDDYLLNKNIVYKYRNIIAIVISLICAAYLVITKNSIINKLVLPFCIYFIVVIIIKLFLVLILDNSMRKHLKEKCMLWANDPKNKKQILNNDTLFINLDEIILYKKVDSDDMINDDDVNKKNQEENDKEDNKILKLFENINLKPFL